MSAAADPIIRLEGVTKVFLTEEVGTYALSGIYLEIAKGEYVSIVGPSGCGKSTLLSILGLLESPTDGLYCLNGRPAADLSTAERMHLRHHHIGFMFQSIKLIGGLTVYENVELPLTYRGMRSAERRTRVQAALERVGMRHRVRYLPCQLSGGQQQRVSIARAIAGEPTIVLADEPTGHLDTMTRDVVLDLFDELGRAGATICMVTHDPDCARRADRTIDVFDGRIVEERAHSCH